MAAGSAEPYIQMKDEVMGGNINFASGADTFKVALVKDTYGPSSTGDNFWGDISAHEVSGGGYTAGGATLANQSKTRDNPNKRVYFDGDDVIWPDASITVRWVVIYKDTGNPATSTLIGYIDLGGNQTSNNVDFLVQFNSTGIVEI